MLGNKFFKRFTFTYPCPRKLREIVKITLFERENPDQIKHLWEEYHKGKYGSLAAIMSSENYEKLIKK